MSKINDWIVLLNSVLLFAVGFFLLLLTWWTGKMGPLIEQHSLFFSFVALFSLFAACIGIRSLKRTFGSTYTFNLKRGGATFSLPALKRGIDIFFQRENPNYQLKSVELFDGGRTLHLLLEGNGSQEECTPVLERLSGVLANQYGFEGQLEVSF